MAERNITAKDLEEVLQASNDWSPTFKIVKRFIKGYYPEFAGYVKVSQEAFNRDINNTTNNPNIKSFDMVYLIFISLEQAIVSN